MSCFYGLSCARQLGYCKVELEIDSAVLAAGLTSKNDVFMADTRSHVRASISRFLRLRD